MTLRHLTLAPLLLATLLLPSACAENAKSAAGATTPVVASHGQDQGLAATAAPTAVPPTKAPGEEAEGSLEAQIQALSVAEGQLDQVLGRGAKKALDADTHKEAPPRDEAPRATGKPSTARGPSPAGVTADAPNAGSVCPMACSALASMARAVARLCSLAGESDRRCEDGRTRERTATQRVHASCPSCGG